VKEKLGNIADGLKQKTPKKPKKPKKPKNLYIVASKFQKQDVKNMKERWIKCVNYLNIIDVYIINI
tara:strand:+ start:214 stop:411 length:198 start_codon:yes stop_codon:yes gene_type:complete